MSTATIEATDMDVTTTNEPTTSPVETTGTFTISDQAVLINVTLRTFGNHRKVAAEVFEVVGGGKVDPEMLRHTKHLVKSAMLKKINMAHGKARRMLYARCLPSPYKRGIYLLPYSLVLKTDDELKVIAAECVPYVEQLCAKWEDVLAEAETRLGPLFDRSQYPSAEELRDRFGLDWEYQEFQVPGQLGRLSRELLARAEQSAERKAQRAAANIEASLAAGFEKVVDKLLEKLREGKVFRDTTVTNIQGFLEILDERNITGSTKIAELSAKAKSVLAGVDPDAVRKPGEFQQRVMATMTEVAEELDKLAVRKPRRAVSLEDE